MAPAGANHLVESEAVEIAKEATKPENCATKDPLVNQSHRLDCDSLIAINANTAED